MEAGPEAVWRGLVAYWSPPPWRGAGVLARALGLRDRSRSGSIEEAGSTVAGFRVERAEPGALLALGGRHRFSRYRLTFEIEDLGGGRSRLTAITDAEFPGPAGRVYKGLVIGTRGHVLAVRRMLAAIRARSTSG